MISIVDDSGLAASAHASGGAAPAVPRAPAGGAPRPPDSDPPARVLRPPQPWPVVRGPADRSAFFLEQAQRRRQTTAHLAILGVAAASLGIPFAVLLAPVGFLLLDASALIPAAVAALAACCTIATLGFWWVLQRPLEGAGAAAILRTLGARPPAPASLDERRLANFVEEMAVAGGLPPPAVRLIDDERPNAAVFGARAEAATVVITRGVLDRVDRAEAQALIAHLVAAAGNGDLRIGHATVSLFETIRLVSASFDAVFDLSRSAARELIRFARQAASPSSPGDAATGHEIADLMDRPITSIRNDGLMSILLEAVDSPRGRAARAVRAVPPLLTVFLPLLAGSMLMRVQLLLVRSVVIGPLLAISHRTRRYHADAATARLIRDPESLARAIERVSGEVSSGNPGSGPASEYRPPVASAGPPLSHIFIAGSRDAFAAPHPSVERRLERIAKLRTTPRPS